MINDWTLKGVKEDRVMEYARETRTAVADNWKGSAVGRESTFHQLSPYVGKMKSSMAKTLVSLFTRAGDTVYDPFCGSGTVAFESWAAGRHVVANDLSPYATVVTRGKLFPYQTSEQAMNEMEMRASEARARAEAVDLRSVPRWVRSFFHPETLREIIAWSQVLRHRRSYMLLSCLLGILHHERPGFLSYPSSHASPYLRTKKFPREACPELYGYRNVSEKLREKIARAFRRVPPLDHGLVRECHSRRAERFLPKREADAIITSPPYMRQLDYARDNRLRLWFLGTSDWNSLDKRISPAEPEFLSMMRRCLTLWRSVLKYKGVCALVLGDAVATTYDKSLPDAVAHIATSEIGDYSVLWRHTEPIPDRRRVRRGYSGSSEETILVLRNERVK